MNSAVRLGISPATATLTGFFSERFWGFISPPWNPGLFGLSPSPVVPPSLSAQECGTTLSTSCCLSHPGPPAATLPWVLFARLPICAPTSLDQCFFFNSLVVGLPYSSIFCQFWLFLLLNCCCPSFGCVRRHSVSTYVSILAISLNVNFFTNYTGCVSVVVAFVTMMNPEYLGSGHHFSRHVLGKLWLKMSTSTCFVGIYHFTSSSVCLSVMWWLHFVFCFLFFKVNDQISNLKKLNSHYCKTDTKISPSRNLPIKVIILLDVFVGIYWGCTRVGSVLPDGDLTLQNVLMWVGKHKDDKCVLKHKCLESDTLRALSFD